MPLGELGLGELGLGELGLGELGLGELDVPVDAGAVRTSCSLELVLDRDGESGDVPTPGDTAPGDTSVALPSWSIRVSSPSELRVEPQKALQAEPSETTP